MTDDVWPMDSRPPSLYTYGGAGTTLFHNSRPDGDGAFFATRWRVFFLPVRPLGRYYVRQGKTVVKGRTTTTAYTFLGQSRVRWWEVARAYLFFWIALPACFLTPILVGVAVSQGVDDNTPYFLGAMGGSFLLLTLLLVGYLIYRSRWRPVREVRWVTRRDSR